jgi:Leucine-rich repeat (LRR) protein
VILDGIDEASDMRDEIIFFITNVLVVGGHHCLVTSRPEGAPSDQFDAFLVLKLKGLRDEDRHKVLQQQFAVRSRQFDRLFELISVRESNDRLYEEELRNKEIERLPGVNRRDGLQRGVGGRALTSSQALFDTAALAYPAFETALAKVVTDLHLGDGQLQIVPLDGDHDQDGLQIPAHVERKVKALGAAHVKDVLSATLYGNSAEEMLSIADTIVASPQLALAGLQNMVHEDKLDLMHHRRIVLQVRVRGFKGSSHVAQVTITHAQKQGEPTVSQAYFEQLFAGPEERIELAELQRRAALMEKIVKVPVLLSLLVVAMGSAHTYDESPLPANLHELYSQAVNRLIEINSDENDIKEKDTLATIKQVATFAHVLGLRVFGNDHAALALEERNLFPNHRTKRRGAKSASKFFHETWARFVRHESVENFDPLELSVPHVPCMKILDASHLTNAYQMEHLSLQEYLCGESFRAYLHFSHEQKASKGTKTNGVLGLHDRVHDGGTAVQCELFRWFDGHTAQATVLNNPWFDNLLRICGSAVDTPFLLFPEGLVDFSFPRPNIHVLTNDGFARITYLLQHPHIHTIRVQQNGLTRLPESLFDDAIYLRVLDLSNNKLACSCPSFKSCNALRELYLQGNRLSGRFPDALFDAIFRFDAFDFSGNDFERSNNLKAIFIYDFKNLKDQEVIDCSFRGLTGEIPDFSPCVKLRQLSLQGNELIGRIPPNLALCTRLEWLDLSAQSRTPDPDCSEGDDAGCVGLSGGVPSFAKCVHLKRIVLSNNNLSGRLPSFARCTALQALCAGGNSLSGKLCSFRHNHELQMLWLHNNRLSGRIPSFAENEKLENLSLWGNRLSSTVPPFDTCTALKELDLSKNRLSGAPPELSGLTSLRALNLYGNKLTDVRRWGALRKGVHAGCTLTIEPTQATRFTEGRR